MAANRAGRAWPALLGRPRFWAITVVPIAIVGGLCWWATAPNDSSTLTAVPKKRVATAVRPDVPATAPPAPAWPASGNLSGAPAKRLLLDTLLSAREALRAVGSYRATFHKQERIKGRLRPEQTLAMKVRREPFAVYLKYLAPKAGKEVVYAEGHHDNKVIAHNGDWTRRLVPRLAVAPTDRIALADSRHPVTEAGIHNLTDRLIAFREKDLTDPDAGTELDRVTDDRGRERLRSVHTHTIREPGRPFARVEVLYDPVTKFPVSLSNFDWPAAGGPAADLDLAERYSYDDLDLGADLTDRDFDTANPEYAFSRY